MSKMHMVLYFIFIMALSLALQWGWSFLSHKSYNLIGGVLVGIGTWAGVMIGDRWRRKALGND